MDLPCSTDAKVHGMEFAFASIDFTNVKSLFHPQLGRKQCLLRLYLRRSAASGYVVAIVAAVVGTHGIIEIGCPIQEDFVRDNVLEAGNQRSHGKCCVNDVKISVTVSIN